MTPEHAPAAVIGISAAVIWLPSKVAEFRARRRAKLAYRTAECQELGEALGPWVPAPRPDVEAGIRAMDAMGKSQNR